MSPQMTIDRLAIIIGESFKDFEARLNVRFERIEERTDRLERKIDTLEINLSNRINKLEQKLDTAIIDINRRIDTTELVVRNHENRITKLED